jgi:predicted component of type VI protein secretion system
MRGVLLVGVLVAAAGCASNRSDEQGARIEDTTLTPRDTVNPNDTMPRIRDSVIDSAQ